MSEEPLRERGESPRTPLEKRKPNQRWFERLSQVLLGEPQDREQLIELLRHAQGRDLLDKEALRMIEGVLRISEFQVRDIMIPRSQMVTIDCECPPDDFLPVVIESAHSRFPVIGETRDEVIGILLAKDLLRLNLKNAQQGTFNLRELIRPATAVPESKRLDTLLREFRMNYNHMAIVVDEFGQVCGLVTIEDILEEIVGEIEDEYDTDEDDENIKQQNEDLYWVKATTPVDEFNEVFGSELSDEEFDTIGGFITNLFGHLPKVDEHTRYDTFEFRILSTDTRRIKVIQVRRI